MCVLGTALKKGKTAVLDWFINHPTYEFKYDRHDEDILVDICVIN